ncbi:hypothetical protein [Ancylomarina longa]|uniref:Uncharacterized protein n=1 Tax=Ancylomarina longa TaxID=2487017 RepID=A0A434AEX8_9BACT|nr:hypothetical protein [Ancylomarina longa]RUT72902.1 hypothetical protein DLK05_16075 [Ancylomarina longa]
MEILIITASFESLKSFVGNLKLIENLGKNYARFQFQDREIDVLISGFGSTVLSQQLTKALMHKSYDLVLQLGECYSLKETIPKEHFVCIIDDYFGDLGIGEKEKYQSVFDINLQQKNEFPFRNEILENQQHFPGIFRDFKKVSGISCGRIPYSLFDLSGAYLKNHPDVISREAASALYICLTEKVKLVQLFYVVERIEEVEMITSNHGEYTYSFSEFLQSTLDELFETH